MGVGVCSFGLARFRVCAAEIPGRWGQGNRACYGSRSLSLTADDRGMSQGCDLLETLVAPKRKGGTT